LRASSTIEHVAAPLLWIWNLFQQSDQERIEVEASTQNLAVQQTQIVLRCCPPCGTLTAEMEAWGRAMASQDAGYDYHRYRKLLAEADDEPKRLALINLLVDEHAREKLAVHRGRELARQVFAPRGEQDTARK
jgi:S-methylmethionine-dependent homocysteine/selenocysteine methylase